MTCKQDSMPSDLEDTMDIGSCDLDSGSPFDILPTQAISHIFNFLPHKDLQSARLVCKQWYFSSLDPKLIDKEQLVIKHRDDMYPAPEGTLYRFIENSERKYYHLLVKSDVEDFFWWDLEFWPKVGHNLKSLSIEGLVSQNSTFNVPLEYCPNLQQLHLQKKFNYTRLDNIPYLPKLRCFTFFMYDGYESVYVKLFQEVVSKAPNLKMVSLNFAEKAKLDADLVAALNIECTVDLRVHLHSKAPVIHDANLANLLKLPNVRLQSMRTYFLPSGVQSTCYIWLKEFCCTWEIHNTDLVSICCNMPNLEKLVLLQLVHATTGLEKLLFLRNLRSLFLKGNTPFHHHPWLHGPLDANLLVGLCSEENTTLKEIVLDAMCDVTPKFLVKFCELHPAITSLTLDSCFGVNDQSVQAVFKYLTFLKSFTLRSSKVSDVGLDGEYIYDLRWGLWHTENPTGYSISRLTELEDLTLDKCEEVRAFFFQNGVEFPRLRVVALGCEQIRERALEVLVENHPLITSLCVKNRPLTYDFLKLVERELCCLKKLQFRVRFTSDCDVISALKSRNIKLQIG